MVYSKDLVPKNPILRYMMPMMEKQYFSFWWKWRRTTYFVRGSQSPSLSKAAIPSPNPLYPFLKLLFLQPFFPLHPLLRHFMQFLSSHPLKVNPSSSFNILTSPTPSHWRYLFTVTNQNHLNFDETSQTNIVGILDILK